MNDEWSSLARKIKKIEVSKHYGDEFTPMQLRMFGEQVYGYGPGGRSGYEMLQTRMIRERGSGQISYLDIAAMLR